MVKVREAIIVEGRYDKNTLSQIVDAPIIQTNGFQILKDKAQLELIRAVASKLGVIIFTDADGAGFVIRNYLKGALPQHQVKHAYIPDIQGKERRKDSPGKEGKLGVEGMTPEIILDALRRAGATIDGKACDEKTEITKVDMCSVGLSGGPDSREKRMVLQKKLGFPAHMSSNALLQALNMLYTKEEFYELTDTL